MKTVTLYSYPTQTCLFQPEFTSLLRTKIRHLIDDKNVQKKKKKAKEFHWNRWTKPGGAVGKTQASLSLHIVQRGLGSSRKRPSASSDFRSRSGSWASIHCSGKRKKNWRRLRSTFISADRKQTKIPAKFLKFCIVHLRTSKRRLILSAQEKRERAHGLRTSASLFNTSVSDWWKYHQPGSSYLDVRNRCALSFRTWTAREFRLPPQRSAPSEVRYLYYGFLPEKKQSYKLVEEYIRRFRNLLDDACTSSIFLPSLRCQT